MKYIFALLFFISLTTIEGQNTEGIVSYQISFDNPGVLKPSKFVTKQHIKMFKNIMSHSKTVELKLLFNAQNSYTTIVHHLKNENINRYLNLFLRSNSTYYFAKRENKITKVTESFGEFFLIENKVEINDWVLTPEIEKIGNYNCFKAKRTISYTSRKGTLVKVKQVVYYAPKIAVPYGPNEFVGFPGLVLKAIDGNKVYTATKIILNPKKTVKIQKIPKGEKTSKEERLKSLMEANPELMKRSKQKMNN